MYTAKHMEFGKAYLDLNAQLDALIKQLVTDAAENLEGWRSADECVEALECRSRDGFIPFSHNCGGYEASNFTDLSAIEGGGNWFASEVANKVIRKQVEQGYADALERFKENYAEQIKGIPEDKLNYHDLYELKRGDLAERLSECEYEELSGENASIMLSVRIMYHGVDKSGEHSASVSASVNWESPYHRQSISWMPGFKCEHAKEVEVTWKTLKGAEQRLRRALKKVTEEIL